MPGASEPSRAGVAAAMRFIAAARRDRALAERLAQAGPEDGLAPVVALAADAGFAFSADELRIAHDHDWGLRRARYLRAPAASADNAVAVVNSPASST